jgi:hypothetical protein
MFLHITSAKYLKDYKIRVAFNNGREGIADLSGALKGPMFEPIRDKSSFSQFRVDKELETVVWPNGADLAPEYIFYLTFRDDSDLQAIFKQWGYIE